MERWILSKILETKNLYKSFGGIKAVQDASCEIESGKIVALIGPNGSGKTTLFNLITGLTYPNSGSIIFDNQDITTHDVYKRAKLGISRMFQQSRLFANLTVNENLLLALDQRNFNFFSRSYATKEQNEKIDKILGLFEIKQKLNSQTKELSFGQRRLVEIARTFLLPHKILLFDEPVAGVTPRLRDEITKFLISLRENGETTFIIEHDMNFVFNLVDEIIVMDAGKCIAKGSPKEIKENKDVKKAYLGQ
jgi:branched-chain amino acid transport system ATP-binding protein